MNEENGFKFMGLFVIGVTTFIIAVLIMFVMIQNIADIETSDGIGVQGLTETYSPLTTTNQLLSPIGEGITSSSVQVYNQTWLEFDGDTGNNQYVNLSSNSNQTSVSLWINAGKQTTNSKGVIGSLENDFLIYMSTSDQLGTVDSGNKVMSIINLSEWYFITITNNETNSLFYLNSELKYVGTKQNISLSKIGNRQSLSGRTFNGSIDKVKVYNYTLYPDEIFKIYREGIKDVENKDFTIVIIPDTQFYSKFDITPFEDQVNWIIDYKEELNIIYVSHLGDVVDGGTNVTQQTLANNTMEILRRNEIPFGIAIGNHDYQSPVTNRNSNVFNTYYPLSDFITKPWFGGNYSNLSENTYHLISNNGNDFIIFNLEFCPRNEVYEWMNETNYNYLDRKLIINTHSFTDKDGFFLTNGSQYGCDYYGLNETLNVSSPLDNWERTLKYIPNLFMIHSGHVLKTNTSLNISTGVNGNTVYGMFTNFQEHNDGSLRYLTFRYDTQEWESKIYSPTLDIFKDEGTFEYSYEVINSLTTNLKFNENSGTTAYDSSGNSNHGTIVGAIWNNDGVLRTLTNGVDYTLNTASGLLTMSSEYLYSWATTTWTYTGFASGSVNTMRENFVEGIDNVTGFIPVIFTILIVIIIISIFVVIYAIYRKMVSGVGGI
jgi:hypothetical protein